MKHECYEKLTLSVVAIKLGRKNKDEVGTERSEA